MMIIHVFSQDQKGSSEHQPQEKYFFLQKHSFLKITVFYGLRKPHRKMPVQDNKKPVPSEV